MKIVSIALASSLALFAACGNSVAPSHSKDQYSGSSFLYLDAADRQKIMSDVKEMVLDNYVLLKIKESRGIVANPTALFDNAVAAEAQRGDVAATDAFAQAESNLQFLDRVKMTIAAFHDTHFSTSALVPRSQVLNGLQVDRVGTDVRVTGLRTAVIDFVRTTAVDPTAYDHITVGLKVVSIDGTPVDDLVKGLQVYESASTTSSGDTWATQDLSLRNFQLPTKNYADWEFSDGTTTLKVRLPYFYLPTAKSGLAPTAPAAPRHDEQVYFDHVGIKPISGLQLTYDQDAHKWSYGQSIGVQGYDRTSPPKGMIVSGTWNDAKKPEAAGEIILRTGYVFKDGKAYGVLQVFGFSAKKVTAAAIGTPVTNANPVIEPVRKFVAELKAAHVPLILDLRQNYGGNPLNAIDLLSAIAKTGESYPSTSRALRVTRIIRQMLDADDLSQLPNYNTYDYDQSAVSELRKAVANHSEYTAAFTLTDDVKADVNGGYNEKIVSLISPMCISACDGMAILLKVGHRATLIGTTTNGTGAGFIGDGVFEDVQWRDRYQVVSLRIPNRLFGYGGALGQHVFSDPNAFIDMNSENRPVAADITYDSTLSDVTNNSEGWYTKAIDTLNQP